MGNLSKHFNRKEFECNGMDKGICNCGFDTIDAETLAVLEDVREYFGQPIHVNSGSRCKVYNAHVGGSTGSKHMEGRAVDIMVKDVSPAVVYNYLTNKYDSKYGLGKYDTFTHIDTRIKKARW